MGLSPAITVTPAILRSTGLCLHAMQGCADRVHRKSKLPYADIQWSARRHVDFFMRAKAWIAACAPRPRRDISLRKVDEYGCVIP